MKLHLGCGERYLEGYVNIDYPSTEHTIQQKSVADQYANIIELKYPINTIEEVRLHHVFEHFTRPVVCALLTNWYFWLKPNGIVHIEVPDFVETAKNSLRLFANEQEIGVGLRHIFGSQEAHWAVHYDGYGKKKLTNLLSLFGFEANSCKQYEYKSTFNIEITGTKKRTNLSIEHFNDSSKKYLSTFMVDDSDTEQRMLQTWLDIYKKHLLV